MVGAMTKDWQIQEEGSEEFKPFELDQINHLVQQEDVIWGVHAEVLPPDQIHRPCVVRHARAHAPAPLRRARGVRLPRAL